MKTVQQTKTFLDQLALSDRFGFLETTGSNWESHRPLLYLALAQTPFADVIEFGSGEGSTPYLKKYCESAEQKRCFNSYDNSKDWCDKTGAEFIVDWDSSDIWNECGLLFVDHAPGEHRKIAVERMRDKAKIIVVHDTELHSAGDYGFDSKKGRGSIWDMFRYVLHYNREGGGAGATAVSNYIDLNRFKFHSLGQYKFE